MTLAANQTGVGRTRQPPRSSATSAGPERDGGWYDRVRAAALQNPLIETRPSLESLRDMNAQSANGQSAPGAVFVGLGICSTHQISRALPVDVLGMLLPAEHLRRTIGARDLVVMIADEHALSNRLQARQVKMRVQSILGPLQRLKRLGLRHMQVVQASSFHHCRDYGEIHAQVRRRAPAWEHPYFLREVADIEYLNRRWGGILKVGWTIRTSTTMGSLHDEIAFDRRFRAWMGRHVGFVYCKAGRVLDDGQPKAAPYMVHDPERRICLHPTERVVEKLERAGQVASRETTRGVRKHLKLITRSYCKLVHPLVGPVEQRVQTIINRACSVEHSVTA